MCASYVAKHTQWCVRMHVLVLGSDGAVHSAVELHKKSFLVLQLGRPASKTRRIIYNKHLNATAIPIPRAEHSNVCQIAGPLGLI